jgi:AraC-like DNA-binding protein
LIAILDCILANIEHATARTPLVLAELEDALMISLLFNFPHSLCDLLEQEVPGAGSWQVKRVEEYIEAHLDAPFNIEQIATVTGISTRSIYRAFKRSRGYSPMAFARQRRLQRARRLLEDRAQTQTVTSVAFVCGFNDVAHFSREFSKTFGESPSAVLSRSHPVQLNGGTRPKGKMVGGRPSHRRVKPAF